jgi:hypothetical protein
MAGVAGRPSKLTPALADDLVLLLAAGATSARAARAVGVSTRSVRRWLRNGLGEQVELARASRPERQARRSLSASRSFARPRQHSPPPRRPWSLAIRRTFKACRCRGSRKRDGPRSRARGRGAGGADGSRARGGDRERPGGAGLAGHANPEVTMRVYADDFRRAPERNAAVLARAAERGFGT